MPPHFINSDSAGEPHQHIERPKRHREPDEPLRIGVGGPVGSGKTALVAALCRQLRDKLSLAVLTNDIYTTEDADFLRRHAVLADQRIAINADIRRDRLVARPVDRERCLHVDLVARDPRKPNVGDQSPRAR